MNYWQGEKIIIRAMESDDFEFLFDILKDSRIQKYESDIRIPMSLEACKEWASTESKKGNDNEEPFLIIEDNDKNIVGMVNPNIIDNRVGVFECGINIKPEYQRKGYAYEAMLLIFKFYFEQKRCVKFEAGIYDYNVSSNRLCEKLGLIVEGKSRKSVFTDGKYYDTILYGLTDDDYYQNKSMV
jgi:RimJ/RimL family protein N-acetyltransferase